MAGISIVLRARKRIDETLHSLMHPSVLESRFTLERKQLPKRADAPSLEAGPIWRTVSRGGAFQGAEGEIFPTSEMRQGLVPLWLLSEHPSGKVGGRQETHESASIQIR